MKGICITTLNNIKPVLSTLGIVLFAALNLHGFRVSSPDGRNSIDVSSRGDSTIAWTAYRDGRCINEPSAIGITIDGIALGNGANLKKISEGTYRDSYSLISANSPIETEWNELVLEAKSEGIFFFIEIRCYDDGVAYRVRVPGDGVRRVNYETVEYKLPLESTVYFGERNSNWKLKSYAGEFTSAPASLLHEISSQGPIQTMPLLYEVSESLYLIVTESALFNYSGMRLKSHPGGSLTSDFSEPDGFDVTGEIVTPWRVLIIEDGLTGLANNHLVTDLAPAPDEELFGNTGWIKPGRSVWSWWSSIDGRFMEKDAECEVIDLAHRLGFEYTTLDEGWEDVPDKWAFVKDIVDYGNSKDVGVILWRHSNRLDNPENDYNDMKLFMDSVASLGVKGLKIDFMNGETKKIIDFTTRALQLAAERKLVINFHGCQKPSGESRTYPNEITREGVRGLELNRITREHRLRMAEKGTPVTDTTHIVGAENQNIPATHDVLLPLTRCIVGNADYTPIGFSLPGNTTWAHHLATAFALNSTLMTMAENPFYLLREKGLKKIVPFIKTMPVVWDETLVLPETKLGESLYMARRSGDEWYIIGITVTPGVSEIALDFINGNHRYKGEMVADSPSSPTSVSYTKGKYMRGERLSIPTRQGGGFILKLLPAKG